MLFLFAAAALQSFAALAAPSSPDPLSVPVGDIVSGNLARHEDHHYFDVYKRWLESPIGSHMKRDADAFLENHPNIAFVECHQGDVNCFLVSRTSLPPKMVRELSEPSIEKRDTNRDRFISTHLKTYEGNEEELSYPMGHEHYLDMNFKCDTLDYRSTGFSLDNFEVKDSAGTRPGQWLFTTTKRIDDPARKVVINQQYICGGWFGNQCCLHECNTLLYVGEERDDFDRYSTCECVSGHSVADQECSNFSGGGWCGVHVTQYQKNEGPGMSNENYRFTVNIKDPGGTPIGEHDMVPIVSGETGEFDSLLPEPFKVYAPSLDDDAIWMHYKDQHFTSNDQEHHCDFGKYDSGKREGDCGFTC